MSNDKDEPKPKKAPTPPAPKPWDRPPQPGQGDKDKQITFAAVGSALTAWETLEEALANAFSNVLLIHYSDTLAAQRAYGSVLTARGRIDMIKSATEAAFFVYPNDQLQEAFMGLLNAVSHFSGRRNEIAHGKVSEIFKRAGFPAFGIPMYPVSAGFVVRPPEYATNKTSLEPAFSLLSDVTKVPAYAYSSVEITGFESHFTRLAEEVRHQSFAVWRYFLNEEKKKKGAT